MCVWCSGKVQSVFKAWLKDRAAKDDDDEEEEIEEETGLSPSEEEFDEDSPGDEDPEQTRRPESSQKTKKTGQPQPPTLNAMVRTGSGASHNSQRRGPSPMTTSQRSKSSKRRASEGDQTV